MFFVEIQDVAALRDRYGYAGFEQLMHDAGAASADFAGDYPGARLNDNAFLVFAAGRDDTQLDALARVLRDGIGQPPFDCDGMPQRLRAAVGYAALRHGSPMPGSVLDGARTGRARRARPRPTGIVAHVPAPSAATVASDLVRGLRAALARRCVRIDRSSRSSRWPAATTRNSRRCCACATPTARCTTPA